MKVFDKASWHIDGGEKKADVIARFRTIFEFLSDKKMLSAEGEETLEYAMDSSIVLTSMMVNAEGNNFLLYCYDAVIAQNPQKVQNNLYEAYDRFINIK